MNEEIVDLKRIRTQMSSICTVLDDMDGYRAWSIVYAARKIVNDELFDETYNPGIDINTVDALFEGL